MQDPCIDLILTNRSFSYKHSKSRQTQSLGISDHHGLIYSMLKSNFSNSEPKLVTYRDYNSFRGGRRERGGGGRGF